MIVAAYLSFFLIHLGLLAAGLRLLWRDRHWAIAIFCLSAFTLVYDNLIIGLGRQIGPGDLLFGLNVGRYVQHALVTPLLMLFGLEMARRAGVAWAATPAARLGTAAIAAAMWAWACLENIVYLQIVLKADDGTLRYTYAPGYGSPVPMIVTIALLIIFGGAVLARARWPWMLAGSTVILILAGAAPTLGVVGNLGEVALMAGLYATARRTAQAPRRRAARSLAGVRGRA